MDQKYFDPNFDVVEDIWDSVLQQQLAFQKQLEAKPESVEKIDDQDQQKQEDGASTANVLPNQKQKTVNQHLLSWIPEVVKVREFQLNEIGGLLSRKVMDNYDSFGK